MITVSEISVSRMKTTIILILLLRFSYTSKSQTTESRTNYELELELPDLPTSHLIRYLNTFPKLKEKCQNLWQHDKNAEKCQKVVELLKNKKDFDGLCWGHEQNPACNAEELRFQTPTCPGNHTGWMQSKQAQIDTYYSQADFGYIRNQLNELELMCVPRYLSDSSLECTKYLRFCRGRNLLFDFRDLILRKEMIRYHTDVLKPGQILGHCELHRTKLQTEMDHNSALQSWSPELRNFEELPMALLSDDGKKNCDLVVNTPTFIMKIDATYNMYHHFCDFFNLYATLFVNQSHPSAFDRNVRILIWETYPYDSPFSVTFRAFSQYPVWTLNDVKGKRICFRNVVLPLLPRMIFGLYYNTPIIQGCHGSGLFRAFSEFILHRLSVPFHPPFEEEKIRITFLSRRTKYRQVLNENELINEISANSSYHVQRISFERGISFTEQLSITRNTDILIGIHGAGLTHLLFLPDWATVFELYNCEDPNCYKDLSGLRGVNYVTWERRDLVYPEDEGHHPQGGAHAKFTNYSFDRAEFARLVAKSANHVKTHKKFAEYQRQKETEKQNQNNNKVEL